MDFSDSFLWRDAAGLKCRGRALAACATHLCFTHLPISTMNILALETSTELCSVALLTGGEIAEQQSEAGQSHSTLVLPMVANLLRGRGMSFDALDGIAFGAGPGAVTGLRIACGVAQGMAAGAGVGVLGISTLEALAEEAWQLDPGAYRNVIACLDARMGEVYWAAYWRDGERWVVAAEPALCAPADVPAQSLGEWAGVGSGFEVYGDTLRKRQSFAAELPGLRPRARTVAALARSRFEARESVSAEFALPLYLRDKVALTVSERGA